MTVWSPQQNEALSMAVAWMRLRYSPFFYLAGYAGTGKTTLAMHIAEQAKGKVAFAAFTGKAAKVMRDKGCAKAKTIHSTIYWTDRDADGNIILNLRSKGELDWCSMFIIDEVSMVDEVLAKDLLSFDKPILVLGDPAQLAPVRGAGFFTSRKPDYMLTEVHRQAAGNPIIALATSIRQGRFQRQRYSSPELTIVPAADLDPAAVTGADTVIVGRNDTRQKYNARLRELKGFRDPYPEIGETLICLKNDREKKISNGEIFLVDQIASRRGRRLKMTVRDPEDAKEGVNVEVRKEFFENEAAAADLPFSAIQGSQHFTYGYAITGHKSQGSQWPNVCVFDQSRVFREDANRWLYTAVTRASEKLTLVI